MPAPKRTDPFRSFNFVVEIDGVAVAGFSEVSGLSSETAVIEYRESGDKENSSRKLPGLTKFDNITLKRGITVDKSLWQWRKSVTDGRVERRNGAIVLLDTDRTPVARWTFRQGWPAKWEGPTLKASGNEVAIETLEITHEGLDLA